MRTYILERVSKHHIQGKGILIQKGVAVVKHTFQKYVLDGLVPVDNSPHSLPVRMILIVVGVIIKLGDIGIQGILE